MTVSRPRIETPTVELRWSRDPYTAEPLVLEQLFQVRVLEEGGRWTMKEEWRAVPTTCHGVRV